MAILLVTAKRSTAYQLYTLLLCQWMTQVWCCHLLPAVTNSQMFLSWLQQVLGRKDKSETCRTCKNLVP